MDAERTMQFLEQQAQFDARQAQFAADFAARQAQFAADFAARQAEFETRHAKFEAKFEEDITRINSILVSVATSQERTNEILVALTEKHLELAESHKDLAKAQKSTEEKLHAVIIAVERHISDHR